MKYLLIPTALLGALLPAQEVGSVSYQIPGTTTYVKTLEDQGLTQSLLSRDGGATWTTQNPIDTTLHIRAGSFDPKSPPALPSDLLAGPNNKLFVVQFKTQIIREFRSAIQAVGGEITYYLPSQSYLVRMDRSNVSKVQAMPFVRSVLDYHLGFRMEPEIIANLGVNQAMQQRYVIVMVDKRADERTAVAEAKAAGAEINLVPNGGLLFEASMDKAVLRKVAAGNSVLWIERWSAPEEDVDNGRIQGGTNYVETLAGIDGKGMFGHVCEGVYGTHTEFAAISPYRQTPWGIGNSVGQGHGNSTAGIIYARGASPTYRGCMPYAQMSYTNYGYVYNTSTRYGLTQTLVDPSQKYKAMVETASWGYARTLVYTSRSAEMDDIIFDLDLYTTQSQSNAGATSNPKMSRSQAWAKNITSIGGFRHGNNSSASDDYWGRTGSTGPASDGRIGVTLSGYYDSIKSTGYSSTSYTTSFGGTSGATPLVNGLSGNMIEMFTDGLFGYDTAPSWNQRFRYVPHFSTTKALLVATASQLTFNSSGTSSGANRYQQGFGFPNLRTAYDNRDRMLVIDELDVLRQGQSRTYYLYAPGAPLHAAMNYPDPPAAANASIHRINSVDLQVTTWGGTQYWGNNGLLTSNNSSSGGSANDRDTEESVILGNVPQGLVAVKVQATGVRRDGHVETARVLDVDYGLVVRGVGGLRDTSRMRLAAKTARGRLSMSLTGITGRWTHGYTLFSLNNTRPVSTGNILGAEFDPLMVSILGMPSGAGNIFHFTNTAAGVYPNAPFAFPAGLVTALNGVTLDSVAFVLDATGRMVGASNVIRFTVQ
jgi:serine protease AprX